MTSYDLWLNVLTTIAIAVIAVMLYYTTLYYAILYYLPLPNTVSNTLKRERWWALDVRQTVEDQQRKLAPSLAKTMTWANAVEKTMTWARQPGRLEALRTVGQVGVLGG